MKESPPQDSRKQTKPDKGSEGIFDVASKCSVEPEDEEDSFLCAVVDVDKKISSSSTDKVSKELTFAALHELNMQNDYLDEEEQLNLIESRIHYAIRRNILRDTMSEDLEWAMCIKNDEECLLDRLRKNDI